MPEDMLPKDIKLESLHTLQDDLARPVSSTPPPSKPKIEIPQIKERNVFPEEVKESSHLLRNILVTLLVVIVLGVSGVAIFRYSQQKSQEAPVSVAPAIKKQQIISYDSEKQITFSDQELSDKNALAVRIYNEARATSTGITFFNINSTLKNIISVAAPSIPDTLSRTLLDDNAFFGGYDSGNFFILSFDSKDLAYAGMLAWEPLMQGDLFPFFSIPTSESIAGFQDVLISNKDARAAVDASGNTLFIYGFFDSTTLIFAKNSDIFMSIQDMLRRKNL